MSKPMTGEMLRALEAMYFEWFSNGPKDMSTEGRHKEIYDAIRSALLKLGELGKRAREIEAYTENRITKAWMTGGLLKDLRDFGGGK